MNEVLNLGRLSDERGGWVGDVPMLVLVLVWGEIVRYGVERRILSAERGSRRWWGSRDFEEKEGREIWGLGISMMRGNDNRERRRWEILGFLLGWTLWCNLKFGWQIIEYHILLSFIPLFFCKSLLVLIL